jgi:hypothetical protein
MYERKYPCHRIQNVFCGINILLKISTGIYHLKTGLRTSAAKDTKRLKSFNDILSQNNN